MTVKHRAGTDEDVRGLRWPYAALERKLAIAVDRARVHAADLQRQCADGERELKNLKDARQDQLRALVAVPLRASGWDVHRQSLQFLARALAELSSKEQATVELRRRTQDAREACVIAHQRLETLAKMRASAEAAYAQVRSRRQAREADLAWLSRHGGEGTS